MYGCLEPACGEGHMARAVSEYFGAVTARDVHPYGYGKVDDFLIPPMDGESFDWIISNPPFRLARQFIEQALLRSNKGVAMLVRTSFLESIDRYEKIFSGDLKPNRVAQFVERVPMIKRRVSREATTATSYCWLIWTELSEWTKFTWIPPCRKRLERPRDYDLPIASAA
jgi:hypothetical protein